MTVGEVDNVNENDSGSEAAASSSQEEERENSQNGKIRSAGANFDLAEVPKTTALEVTVDHSIEKAMKILKRKLIKEGLFKELKMRRYYEKPCERRKRKQKESLKKTRKEASRLKKNPFM